MRKAAMRVSLAAALAPSQSNNRAAGAQANQGNNWRETEEQGVERHGPQHGQGTHAEAGSQHHEPHEVQGVSARFVLAHHYAALLLHVPHACVFLLLSFAI